MKEKAYARQNAVEYAKFWALDRNPYYYNFDKIGGDCTNFVSQCIYSGSGVMNYTKITGWFYNSINDRAPSWSGVDELYNFLINNKSIGPFGIQVDLRKIEIGDVIEFGNINNDFFHTVIVSKITENRVFVCSHTRNALDAPIEYFNFDVLRCIHILGVRTK